MHVVLNQPENVELARYYIKTLREVKEKKTFRMCVMVFKVVSLFLFDLPLLEETCLVSLSQSVILMGNIFFMFIDCFSGFNVLFELHFLGLVCCTKCSFMLYCLLCRMIPNNHLEVAYV